MFVSFGSGFGIYKEAWAMAIDRSFYLLALGRRNFTKLTDLPNEMRRSNIAIKGVWG